MAWWHVLVGTYAAVWRHLPALALAAIPATLAIGGLTVLPMLDSAVALILLLPLIVIAAFFLSMLLISLQRRLLFPDAPHARMLRVRPDWRDWKAFGAALAIWIATRIGRMAGDMLLAQASEVVGYVFMGLYLIGFLYLFPRVMMVFPAIATDTPGALSAAWRNSDGMQLLFWPSAVTILIFYLAFFAGMHAATDELQGIAGVVGVDATFAIPNVFALVLCAALLAQIHMRLAGNAASGGPTTASTA